MISIIYVGSRGKKSVNKLILIYKQTVFLDRGALVNAGALLLWVNLRKL